MKKKIVILLLFGVFVTPICTIMLPTTPVFAQAAFAEKIGTKLLTSVLGTIVGKEFGSIFGEGPQPVTKEQLADALKNSFKSAKLKDIEADVDNLKSKVRAYQKSGSNDSRREQIDTITDLADHIRSNIQVQIHHGAFFDLLPDYMTAMSIWLAFKTERKWVGVGEDATAEKQAESQREAIELVASEAVHALSMVHDFYYHDFVDTGTRRCFKKRPNQHLFGIKGNDIPNHIGISKSRPKKDFSTLFCFDDVKAYCIQQFPSVGAMAALNFFPHQDFYRSFRTFKHPRKDEWFYTYETSIGRKHNGEYTLGGPYPTRAKAEFARVANSIVFYGDIVGNIPGIVRRWEDLAVGISEHINVSHYKTEAKRLSHELGAR
jgi:hypothetical protein